MADSVKRRLRFLFPLLCLSAVAAAQNDGSNIILDGDGAVTWGITLTQLDPTEDTTQYLLAMRCNSHRAAEERLEKILINVMKDCCLDCFTESILSEIKNELKHLPDCPWHKDWHSCSCGIFDKVSQP